MTLKNNLEIIMQTYNRKKYLKNTFNQIFDENSPIKDFDITILDNKSDDGTSELIQEYVKKFPNIKHIIHNRNIGGPANTVRAFEIASKKYIWILCDDDRYDFTHWADVEEAIEQDYDAIVVANYINPKKHEGQLSKQMTFVPSTIYKTENITATVMQNMSYNIYTLFPQMAIVCKLLNDNKRIKILDNWIVTIIPHHGMESYTRGLDDDKHPYMAQNFWQIGYINSVQMIKDKKKRAHIINNMEVNCDKNLYINFIMIFLANKNEFNNSRKNLHDVWVGINFYQKIIFILAFMRFFFAEYIFNVYYDEKFNAIYFRVLGEFFKTRIKLPAKEEGTKVAK